MNNWTFANDERDSDIKVTPSHMNLIRKEASSFDLFELLEKCQGSRLNDQRFDSTQFLQVSVLKLYRSTFHFQSNSQSE